MNDFDEDNEDISQEQLNLMPDGEDIPSALSSYLRQIHAMPPVSPESQEEFGKQIVAADDAMRNALAPFGFTIKEHIITIDNFLSGSTSAADIFAPSTIKNIGPNPVKLKATLQAWRDDIDKFYTEYRAAFEGKGSDREALLNKYRAEAGALLALHPFSSDKYGELVSSLTDFFMITPQNRLNAGSLDFIPEKELAFTELKFLFDRSEIVAASNQVLINCQKLLHARNDMLEHNLRLVVSIAKNYSASRIPISDIIQEGNLGLLRAIEKFDFRLGYKFSTYAIWWIKQNISRYIAENSRIIRIPAHMIQTITAMNSAEQRFIMENGRDPEVQELAMMLEMPVARINAIRKMARQPISLQSPISGDDGAASLEELLPDPGKNIDPTEQLAGKINENQLHLVLSMLPEREQSIIIDRFGLFGHKQLTLSEISERFGLTRERIRQLEMKIMKKLRSPEMLKYFDKGEE